MAGISASAVVAHESEELGVITELGCCVLWLRTERRLWVPWIDLGMRSLV